MKYFVNKLVFLKQIFTMENLKIFISAFLFLSVFLPFNLASETFENVAGRRIFATAVRTGAFRHRKPGTNPPPRNPKQEALRMINKLPERNTNLIRQLIDEILNDKSISEFPLQNPLNERLFQLLVRIEKFSNPQMTLPGLEEGREIEYKAILQLIRESLKRVILLIIS
jgi:hypothetical protein